MERPQTSKPRGICRYYKEPRGCFAGDRCKFIHADSLANEVGLPFLTPYDNNKTCRYYANGYCRRGEQCWFRHTLPEQHASSSKSMEGSSSDDMCSICLEKPITYGLLVGCNHMFCIQCLKQWRDPTGKPGDVVDSGVNKKCPMCRTSSKFIVPSSIFYEHGSACKERIVNLYKDSMARIPCRYFKLNTDKRPLCPFGKDCFYQHLNEDGTPYIFTEGVEVCMRRYRSRTQHLRYRFQFAEASHSPSSTDYGDSEGEDATFDDGWDMVFSNEFDGLSESIEAVRTEFRRLDEERDRRPATSSSEDREFRPNVYLEGMRMLTNALRHIELLQEEAKEDTL